MDDLAAWLDQILKDDKARASSPTFCSPVWPTAEHLLAWIEADRQILDEHATIDPGEDWAHCRRCEDRRRHDAMNAPCTTVRILAARHADRPGFREEWKP